MSFQEEVDRTPGKLIQGSGYSVKECIGLGTIKYSRANRSILLSAELVDRTREFGRSWLVFPTYALVITTPAVLRWDDGTELDLEESNKVREQVALALDKIGRKHFFEIDDQQTDIEIGDKR